MLLPSCFKHWIQSMKFALVGYLNDACAALDKAIQIEMTKGDSMFLILSNYTYFKNNNY